MGASPSSAGSSPLRDYCTQVLHLATYVMDANELADITVLKEKAKTVEAMTHQLLKIYREV